MLKEGGGVVICYAVSQAMEKGLNIDYEGWGRSRNPIFELRNKRTLHNFFAQMIKLSKDHKRMLRNFENLFLMKKSDKNPENLSRNLELHCWKKCVGVLQTWFSWNPQQEIKLRKKISSLSKSFWKYIRVWFPFWNLLANNQEVVNHHFTWSISP